MKALELVTLPLLRSLGVATSFSKAPEENAEQKLQSAIEKWNAIVKDRVKEEKEKFRTNWKVLQIRYGDYDLQKSPGPDSTPEYLMDLITIATPEFQHPYLTSLTTRDEPSDRSFGLLTERERDILILSVGLNGEMR